ncbi:MAG: Nif3-like dinuclear metal center hexameric protein [Firmicutes bacterium]|nr:Nif3-like dinuclear metal center hexameric protein [Bacillota bacterium]
MSTVKQITNLIEQIAPQNLTAPNFDDNVGLIIGNENVVVTKTLVCLDVTEAVLDEAVSSGANLIISHHPFIFFPIKRITNSDLLGKKIIKALKHGINIYSAHTNLDFCEGGINDYLVKLFSLKSINSLEQYKNDAGQIGIIGHIGELEKELEVEKFAKLVSKILQDNNIKIVNGKNKTVKKVAIISGSGGEISYIDKALSLGCDCFITADVKHYIASYANEMGFTIIEPTHYSTEKVGMEYFAKILSKALLKEKIEIEVISSKSEKSPYL